MAGRVRAEAKPDEGVLRDEDLRNAEEGLVAFYAYWAEDAGGTLVDLEFAAVDGDGAVGLGRSGHADPHEHLVVESVDREVGGHLGTGLAGDAWKFWGLVGLRCQTFTSKVVLGVCGGDGSVRKCL